MKKKNLFSAVKTFINNTPVGETFTTKQLIASVGNQEEPSRWKTWNNNPFYRTHTYKSYLRRAGFLDNIKYGVWEVSKHIPESYNLGTIEFLIGYKGKTYNGMTREEILNQKSSLQTGDALSFTRGSFAYAANDGAKAIFQGKKYTDQDGGELISVKWVRDGNDNGQNDGEYFSSMFTKVEEVSPQKEVRILDEIKKEKVMKFDLEKGKQRLIEYFEMEFERASMYSLEYIKECDDMDDVKSEVRSFNAFEEVHFKLRAKIDRASTLSLVFEALVDTCLEDDDETILSFFIEGLQ
jgi:hypothetical protein